MKKYKLINIETKEEHLCDKVTVDDFDYYVQIDIIVTDGTIVGNNKKIATTNPNIDVPKVVDEVENVFKTYKKGSMYMANRWEINNQYKQDGYNKAKETYKFTEEDMIEFAEFILNDYEDNLESITDELKWKLCGTNQEYSSKELLQLWLENRIETIYFK